MDKPTIADLREISAFKELDDPALQWLLDRSELTTLQEDEYLFRKGDPIDNMHIILKGKLRIKVMQGKQFRDIGE